MTCIYK